MAAPNSYKDPYWSDLAMATEAKLGLPAGLLAAVVTKGERSNADQVSEAGAKTPFQIIPATRKAAIDKYGIDPYLSPENAAEVAGLLLKDSLARNKGNVPAAVAEYHGGTDRANWGPRTRAYVARVTGAQQAEQAPQQAGGSTFQRALASQQAAAPASSISAVYEAYSAGKMTPQEASEFEADVKGGLVMLPRGASLKGQAAPSQAGKPAPAMLPKEVTDAYVSGRMSEQERADLEADMAAGIVRLPATTASQIPTEDPNWQPPTEQGIIPRQVEPTLGQRLVGAGEAGLTMLTGMTGGMAGMAGGTAKGVAKSILDGTFGTQQAADMVEREAAKSAESLTYMPRTQTGQEYAQNVGRVLSETIPAVPLTAEMGMLGSGLRQAAPAAELAARQGAAAASRVAAPVVQQAGRAVEAVRAAPGRAAEAVGLRQPSAAPTAGTGGSVGAAGVDVATLRQAKADELPVPIELTKGQRERTFEQQQFEREVAKNPEVGAPIRERFASQNEAIYKNFDAFVDMTGAETADLRSVGTAVDKAIRARAARDKAKIRTLYKEAEKSGEMESPVKLESVVQHLNESAPEAEVANVLKAVRAKAIQLGIATEDHSTPIPGTYQKGMHGTSELPSLVPRPVPLKTAELFRRSINGATNAEPTNIRQATIMKGLVDEATENLGGNLYKQARAARSRYAHDYENIGLIKDLMGMKRTSSDRVVALENVFNRSIKNGSLDDVRQLRRILHTEGEAGTQAWKELQGATVRHIQESAFGNSARDVRGNPVLSPAGLDRVVTTMDKSGKLDFIFGKRGAEQIRLINDVAKDVATAPPGAVNTSNTASALITALDTLASYGTTGLPVPIAHALKASMKSIKERKLRARVRQALQRN